MTKQKIFSIIKRPSLQQNNLENVSLTTIKRISFSVDYLVLQVISNEGIGEKLYTKSNNFNLTLIIKVSMKNTNLAVLLK